MEYNASIAGGRNFQLRSDASGGWVDESRYPYGWRTYNREISQRASRVPKGRIFAYPEGGSRADEVRVQVIGGTVPDSCWDGTNTCCAAPSPAARRDSFQVADQRDRLRKYAAA